jgi:Zn-dependent metalloprotease
VNNVIKLPDKYKAACYGDQSVMSNKNSYKKLLLAMCGVLVVAVAVVTMRPAEEVTTQSPKAVATTASKNTFTSQTGTNVKSLRAPINAVAVNDKIKQGIAQKAVDPVSDALVDLWNLDKKNQFKNTKTNEDKNGKTHARYKQMYDGIPVWGGDVIVHADQTGEVKKVTGKQVDQLEKKLAGIDLKAPKVSPSQALDAAKQKAGDFINNASADQLSFRGEKTDMIIYVDNSDNAHQVYHVNYVVEAPAGIARPNLMINAQTGDIITQWNGLTTDAVGTGPGGNQKTGQYEFGTTPNFGYLDVTPDALNINCTMTDQTGYVSSVNLQQGTFKYIPWVYPCFRNVHKAVNGGYSPINDAHFFGVKTADMYRDWIGKLPTFEESEIAVDDSDLLVGNGTITDTERSETSVTEVWTVTAINATTFSVVGSVSGAKANATVGELYDNQIVQFKINDGAIDFAAGDTFLISYETMPLLLRSSYNIAEENAYWDGTYLDFGDGDNYFYPLSSAGDIVSHEASHAFTQFNSNLKYEGASGGVNEAFSDIAGEALEFYWRGFNDWEVAADVVKGNNNALRYFENPPLDDYSITHLTRFSDSLDVHSSSGIFNRASYVIANLSGPDNWNTQKVFEIYAAANENYWTELSDFEDASCGVLNATVDAGYDPDPVRLAFQSVGVFCDDTSIILDKDNDEMSDRWEAAQIPPLATLNAIFTGAGNGTLTNLSSASYSTETWTITATSPTEFSVVGSISGAETPATVGEFYSNGYIAFKINVGTTSFIVGDTFTVAVVADEDIADYDADGFSNIEEYKAGSNPRAIKSVPIQTLFGESFEGDRLPPGWTTTFGSEKPWAPLKNFKTATDLFYSLAAKPKPGQYSQVEFTANFVDGTYLYFDQLVQTTEGKDISKVYVDGKFWGDSSGYFTDWQNVAIPMTGGKHTIVFGFIRDDKSPDSEKSPKTVYMDNIRYTHLEADTDGDGLGDSIDSDDDNDGASDVAETKQGTNPLTVDFDGDGFLDGVDAYPTDGARIGIQGTASSANLGNAVASADVDGNGVIDVVVGSYKEDPVNQTTGSVMKDAGTVKVYSGVDGTLLYRWLGEAAGDNFGISIANAGDVNNDGNDDVIIGATGFDAPIVGSTKKLSSAGAAYVYSGVGTFGTRLYKFEGKAAGDGFGIAVAGGNIDGDDNADLVVGAHLSDPVIVGKKSSSAGSVYAYSGSNGAQLNQWNGEAAGDAFGSAVTMGDVNNDGTDDIIIGAPKRDVIAGTTLKDVGTVYAYSGNGFAELIRWNGVAAGDAFGSSVAAGAVDADDGSDIVVGAPKRDSGTLKDTGAISAYSGVSYAPIANLSKMGSAAGDAFGTAVAVGAIDGVVGDDVVVGICKSDYISPTPKTYKDAGSANVYSGVTGASLVTGTPLTGTSASQWFGCAVATGDTNDDGFADVIVGSPNADPLSIRDAGSVEIYLGDGL